jgi:hypothetical protein
MIVYIWKMEIICIITLSNNMYKHILREINMYNGYQAFYSLNWQNFNYFHMCFVKFMKF